MSRFLAAYSTFVSKATDAPPEFGQAAALSCLSTISLSRRWLKLGLNVHPNIFIMLTASSSKDRKSDSVEFAAKLMGEVEDERVGPPDFSGEALVAYMRKKPGKKKAHSKMTLFMPEFGTYLATTGTYNPTANAILCQLYDGKDFKRVRVGKPVQLIEKPRLSLLGGVAYGMLEKYADPKDWATGFFSRMIWIRPDDIQRPQYPKQPQFPSAEFDLAKAALIDLREELKGSIGAMGISAQGETEFLKFAASFKADSTDYSVVAQRERLVNAAWKLAMLYQVDDNPQHQIGPQAVQYAAWFVQKSWTSFRQIFKITNTTDPSRLARKIHARVFAAGPEGILRREIYRRLGLRLDQFAQAIDSLIRNGAIREIAAARKDSVKLVAEDPPSDDNDTE